MQHALEDIAANGGAEEQSEEGKQEDDGYLDEDIDLTTCRAKGSGLSFVCTEGPFALDPSMQPVCVFCRQRVRAGNGTASSNISNLITHYESSTRAIDEHKNKLKEAKQSHEMRGRNRKGSPLRRGQQPLDSAVKCVAASICSFARLFVRAQNLESTIIFHISNAFCAVQSPEYSLSPRNLLGSIIYKNTKRNHANCELPYVFLFKSRSSTISFPLCSHSTRWIDSVKNPSIVYLCTG